MHVRKVLFAAGSLSLLLLGGKLALDCKRHNQSRTQPTTLPATMDLENQSKVHSVKMGQPIPAEKIEKASDAFRTLTELSRSYFQEPPARSLLEEKFNELKDDPAPVYDHQNIEIRKDEICPGGKYSGRVMAYSGGNFLGYMEFSSGIKVEIYNPIVNHKGEFNGYSRSSQSPWTSFLSRGCKKTRYWQSYENEQFNLIYQKDAPYEFSSQVDPIGRFDKDKNQYENQAGKALGRLDGSQLLVPIYLSPLCEENEGIDKSVTFLRFSSYEEWHSFMVDTFNLFPKEMIEKEGAFMEIERVLGLKDVPGMIDKEPE